MKRKFDINDDFFKVINTEHSAYWLGFILADGCVYGPRLQIILAKKDRTQLLKFLKSLSSNYSIVDGTQLLNGKRHETSGIYSVSAGIVSDLARYGVTENKSLTAEPYYDIAPDLRHHYIRGIFDADGSLHEAVENTYSEWQMTFAGTRAVVQFCIDWVTSLAAGTEYEGTLKAKEPKAHESIFRVAYSGMGLLQLILGELYKDATVYLDRKYELTQKCLAQERQRRRWQWLTEEKLNKLYLENGRIWRCVADALEIEESELDQIRERIGGAVGPATKKDYGFITREEVLAAIANNKTRNAAAKSLGVSQSTFRLLYRKFGIPATRKEQKSQNPEGFKQAIETGEAALCALFEELGTNKKVGEHFGISEQAMRRVRVKIGGKLAPATVKKIEISPEQIMEAYKNNRELMTETAKALGISVSQLQTLRAIHSLPIGDL